MTRWELISAANRVMAGEYGNGEKRKRKLGKDYVAVQAIVNVILQYEDSKGRRIAWLEEELRKEQARK